MVARFYQRDWTEGTLTTPPSDKLAGGAPFLGVPVGHAMRAQDEVCSLSRRVLLRVGNPGNFTWKFDVEEPGGSPNDIPTYTEAQIIAQTRLHVLQGMSLRVSLLHLGSGPISGNNFETAAGRIRITAAWTSTGNATLDNQVIEIACPNGPGVGVFDTLFSLAGVMEAEAMIRIGTQDRSTRRDLDEELCELNILVERVGAARIVDLVITEVPERITKEDTDSVDDWVGHVYEDGGGPPKLYYPSEQASDATGQEDPRRGTHMILDVANAQIKRVGPILATWSAYDENVNSFNDGSEINGITTLSTTPIAVGSMSSSSGSNALNTGISHEIATGGSGSIPVRVRVYGKSDLSSGVVVVKTSDHQSITVDVDSTMRGWFEGTGTLEVGRQPGQILTFDVEFFDTNADIVELLYFVIEREPNASSW